MYTLTLICKKKNEMIGLQLESVSSNKSPNKAVKVKETTE